MVAKTISCSVSCSTISCPNGTNVYKDTGKGLSYGTCSARLPSLKKAGTAVAAGGWIASPCSQPCGISAMPLIRFFKKQNRAPRFKSKRNPIQSYTTKLTNGSIAVVRNKLKLPQSWGWSHFREVKEVDGRILGNATIRRNSSGSLFISILVETEVQVLPKTGSVWGVDVGGKDFAVVSDETVYGNPRFFRKLERKLTKEQRILSKRMEQAQKDGRKLSESKNYQKQRVKVARIHERISNARTDYLRKYRLKSSKITTSSASRICWFPA